MQGLMDLARVLFSPGEVFAGLKEKPRILVPLLGLLVLQIVLLILSRPFLIAVARNAAAAAPEGARLPSPETQALFGMILGPIGLIVILLLTASLLWVVVSVLGGEGKFRHLFSVSVHAFMPQILFGIVGIYILTMRGPESVTTQIDLQPSLGLDLIVGRMMDLGAFVTVLLRGINPFAIWGLVLTAIGIEKTHAVEKGTAYTAAITVVVLGLLIRSVLALVSQ